MKLRSWWSNTLVIASVFLVVFVVRGCVGCVTGGGKAPDEKLAGQFRDLCSIAKSGAKEPVAGVKKWGRYMLAHTGDMMKNFADTFAEIEMIADDEEHDKRAYVARDRIWEPVVDCVEAWDKFAEAIMNNDEAEDMLDRAMERLDRSLDIVLGEGQNVTFKDLPRELVRRFDAATIRK